MMMSAEPNIFEYIKSGDYSKVKILIDENPHLLTARNESGVSALMVATYYNRTEIQRLFLEKGLSLDVFEAAAVGNVQVLSAILQHQPLLLNAYSADGFQPLGLAAFFGKPEAVKFLIDFGALVNEHARNRMGVMPLHSALANRKENIAYEIAKLLIAKGADVNAVQNGGWSPLHQAAAHGFLRIIDLLLENGAKLNRQNDDGRTPVKIAKEYNQHDALKKLVEKGAEI